MCFGIFDVPGNSAPSQDGYMKCAWRNPEGMETPLWIEQDKRQRVRPAAIEPAYRQAGLQLPAGRPATTDRLVQSWCCATCTP